MQAFKSQLRVPKRLTLFNKTCFLLRLRSVDPLHNPTVQRAPLSRILGNHLHSLHSFRWFPRILLRSALWPWDSCIELLSPLAFSLLNFGEFRRSRNRCEEDLSKIVGPAELPAARHEPFALIGLLVRCNDATWQKRKNVKNEIFGLPETGWLFQNSHQQHVLTCIKGETHYRYLSLSNSSVVWIFASRSERRRE